MEKLGSEPGRLFDTPAPMWEPGGSVVVACRRTGRGRRQSSGGYRAGETPVPIPNTVVKARSADGTAAYQRWKNRSPPDTFRGSLSWGSLFAFLSEV